MRRWSEEGAPLIITSNVQAPDVWALAPQHPDVHYVVIDKPVGEGAPDT